MKLKTIIFLAIFSLTSSRAFAGLSVTCSLFPVYDFTRSITGTLADVKLLLPPGIEPHEYEPSPRDIKALNDSDVFVFTSVEMEAWSAKISLPHTKKVNASEGIALVNNDPHVWLDISLSKKMAKNILEALCSVDPENSSSYRDNYDKFCERLDEIDAKFMNMKKNKALVFAGEFSAGYFMRRYGFDYVSAYDGENEPSVKRMAEILRYIKEHKTRYIFTDTGAIPPVTREISSQSGAEILTFATGHNVPDTDTTFIGMMTENYHHVQEAMND